MKKQYCDKCGQQIIQGIEWGKTADCRLNWEDAKKWCEKQGEGWRLPTLEELKQAYDDKVEGFVTKDAYWSSNENDTNYAWFQYFISGTQTYNDKTNTNYVRCVRSI
jgi:hypothetical protein